MKLSGIPGWEIELAWRQKVAAYWSIFWPAWVAYFSAALLLTSGYQPDDLLDQLHWLSIGGNVAFFGIQALSTRRIVSKNYRSFRVVVLREDGQRGRKLSMREAGMVWLWIFVPQFALLFTTSLIVWLFGSNLPPETIRSIASLSLWVRILVAGPYGIGLALSAHHPGFRLQAYGYRYI